MRKNQICIKLFVIVLFLDSVELIADGRLADSRRYPYIVRLERVVKQEAQNVCSYEYICTGTVLKPMWTITAGQCTTKLSTMPAVIIFGNNTSLRARILDVITHPNYYSIRDGLKPLDRRQFSQAAQFWNDIGLVRHSTITLETYGQISALTTESLIRKRCHLFGYGFTNVTDEDIYGNVFAAPIDGLLRSLDFVVSKCSRITPLVYPGICGTAECKTSGTACYGDAGGPAICFSRVVAVITAGLNTCDLVDYPSVGVFTPVNSYIRWIYGHVNKTSDFVSTGHVFRVRDTAMESQRNETIINVTRQLMISNFTKDHLYEKRNRQLLEDIYEYYETYR